MITIPIATKLFEDFSWQMSLSSFHSHLPEIGASSQKLLVKSLQSMVETLWQIIPVHVHLSDEHVDGGRSQSQDFFAIFSVFKC